MAIHIQRLLLFFALSSNKDFYFQVIQLPKVVHASREVIQLPVILLHSTCFDRLYQKSYQYNNIDCCMWTFLFRMVHYIIKMRSWIMQLHFLFLKN